MKKTNSFEKQLTLLIEADNKIEKWLKEEGVSDECIGAGFEPIEGHQGRAMDFEYKGNVEYLTRMAKLRNMASEISKEIDEIVGIISQDINGRLTEYNRRKNDFDRNVARYNSLKETL